jgi:hypothetical protein
MKKMFITAGLVFISTFHSPFVASAEPSSADPRITETFQLYSAFCLGTGGAIRWNWMGNSHPA